MRREIKELVVLLLSLFLLKKMQNFHKVRGRARWTDKTSLIEGLILAPGVLLWSVTANAIRGSKDDEAWTSQVGVSADNRLPGNVQSVRYNNNSDDNSQSSTETVVIKWKKIGKCLADQ